MFFSSWTVLAAPIFGATGTIIMFFSSYNMPQSTFGSGFEAGNWQRVPASFAENLSPCSAGIGSALSFYA
jgi:hypothetical protein